MYKSILVDIASNLWVLLGCNVFLWIQTNMVEKVVHV